MSDNAELGKWLARVLGPGNFLNDAGVFDAVKVAFEAGQAAERKRCAALAEECDEFLGEHSELAARIRAGAG